jgi:hypothetical protein
MENIFLVAILGLFAVLAYRVVFKSGFLSKPKTKPKIEFECVDVVLEAMKEDSDMPKSPLVAKSGQIESGNIL